jgi:outer membrane lipoprotein SlyB
MRNKTLIVTLGLVVSALSAPSADAKGCIKGALVGGVAGHYAAHHGLLGAAAGCVIGRHEAKKREREQETDSASKSNFQKTDNGLHR